MDFLKPIIGGCGMPPNFAEKTFVDGSPTLKSAKVFSLESFPLYMVNWLAGCYTSHGTRTCSCCIIIVYNSICGTVDLYTSYNLSILNTKATNCKLTLPHPHAVCNIEKLGMGLRLCLCKLASYLIANTFSADDLDGKKFRMRKKKVPCR